MNLCKILVVNPFTLSLRVGDLTFSPANPYVLRFVHYFIAARHKIRYLYHMNRFREDFWLRVLCFLACIPSGGALLAKVFGIASLQSVMLFVFLPCAVFLTVVWVWAGKNNREYLHQALVIGFWGGLLGTLAYDAVRIPFLVLLGQRVFAPISVYGVWLAEADISSRLSEILGWGYHFSNGITFGIMYALFMRRRHWLWAIPWAFLLETIAIFSPFSQIFNLSGNYGAIGIAYLGHVAYGLPLGWLVYKWDKTMTWKQRNPAVLRWAVPLSAVLIMAFIVFSPLVRPTWIARENRAVADTLLVEGIRLNPDWVRIDRGETVTIRNDENRDVSVVNNSAGTSLPITAGAQETVPFPETGIYQLFVETESQTRSSFVIVEPVEDLH